ncbi:hypothetical protein PSEUBRA_005893 [Kalmanozyma brasiliensis GHG001]|uniref:uncharacterized protein n=1 Tax=Kalmanozyma brasiliensis (strain GHG001) TaxID=1365824 RepID=UPI0028681854|nr:uncharacterized protein PSEUBRA_005893 [Kalmanozyma brasiliensis GHG001]KAF6767570.1 hypothetical protein PSEUBRA_005893 [Kalmanozyma brasiliensis GHG001]
MHHILFFTTTLLLWACTGWCAPLSYAIESDRTLRKLPPSALDSSPWTSVRYPHVAELVEEPLGRSQRAIHGIVVEPPSPVTTSHRTLGELMHQEEHRTLGELLRQEGPDVHRGTAEEAGRNGGIADERIGRPRGVPPRDLGGGSLEIVEVERLASSKGVWKRIKGWWKHL